MSAHTARIRTLVRYPVKSMAGEALSSARVLPEHGLQGDRAFAVLDVRTGRIASAKHPRLWGGLLDYRPRFVEPPAAGFACCEGVSFTEGELFQENRGTKRPPAMAATLERNGAVLSRRRMSVDIGASSG